LKESSEKYLEAKGHLMRANFPNHKNHRLHVAHNVKTLDSTMS